MNSDPKQCTVTKLGRVHSAHNQNPGRVHTARAVPRSCELLRAQQAGHARMRAWSREMLRLPLSRPKAQVATPNGLIAKGPVATPKKKKKNRSQPNCPSPCLGQVATTKRGRDTASNRPGHYKETRSRRQWHASLCDAKKRLLA